MTETFVRVYCNGEIIKGFSDDLYGSYSGLLIDFGCNGKSIEPKSILKSILRHVYDHIRTETFGIYVFSIEVISFNNKNEAPPTRLSYIVAPYYLFKFKNVVSLGKVSEFSSLKPLSRCKVNERIEFDLEFI